MASACSMNIWQACPLANTALPRSGPSICRCKHSQESEAAAMQNTMCKRFIWQNFHTQGTQLNPISKSSTAAPLVSYCSLAQASQPACLRVFSQYVSHTLDLYERLKTAFPNDERAARYLVQQLQLSLIQLDSMTAVLKAQFLKALCPS